MLSSNIPNNLPALEKIIRRIVAAEKSQQKDIRISIQEARELTQELAILTSNLGNTVAEIHQILKEIRENTTEIDVKFDGGGF
jgi:chromosomal replication initiation ATPase DnaA